MRSKHMDLEACWAFVYANRLVAELLKDRSRRLWEIADAECSPELEEVLKTIARGGMDRAAKHEQMANAQERDIGVKCYCEAPLLLQ